MDSIYNSEDLENMKNIREFFNPGELLNPGKIFPQPGRCAEVKHPSGVPDSTGERPRMVAAKSGIAV
jgi:hypothetical protein